LPSTLTLALDLPALAVLGQDPLKARRLPLDFGLEDDLTAFTAAWSPGDRLLLYTDGLVESRDVDPPNSADAVS